jgi:hypothetical protein
MLKTIARGLAGLLLAGAIVFALFGHQGAGWRWLISGGWHSSARIAALTPEEQTWAAIAWRYFVNNTQPQTGLVNGSDKQPRVTLWQMGDTLIALLAAKELGLIEEAEYDARLTRLMGTLNRLMLTEARTPGRLYSSQTATPIDFSGKPVKNGWSARDMARLMLALRLTAEREPQYSEYLDKIILRWNFCPVIDVKANCGHLPCKTASRWCARSCAWARANMPQRRFSCGDFPRRKRLRPRRTTSSSPSGAWPSMPGIRAPRGSPP